METDKSKDLAEQIISKLFDTYGVNIIWVVSVLTFLYVGYKILRTYGYIQNPTEKNIDDIKKEIYDIKILITTNSLNILSVLNSIAKQQKAYLTVEGVNIIIKIAFEYIKRDLIDCVSSTFEGMTDKETSEIFEAKLQKRFEIILIDIDREFFKLPNVDQAVIQLEDKLSTLFDFNFYSKVSKFAFTNYPTSDEVRSLAKDYLESLITKSWYIRTI
jgi:hypothetical protein